MLNIDQCENSNVDYELKLVLVRERIKNKGEKRSKIINEKHTAVEYEIGQLVLVRALNVLDTLNKIFFKFLQIFEGPYYIVEKNNDTYTLQHMNSDVIRGKFHCGLLRPYNVWQEEIGQEVEEVAS